MRNHPDALMLFAAGFGTRMGSLTQAVPKPLIEVEGKPLVDHALDIAHAAGIDRVVANLHYLPEQLAAHLAPKGVALSLEDEQILETGGGLRQALPLLGEGPVFTLNTDAVWSGRNPLEELAATWDPSRMDALLLLLPPDRATGHNGTGDFTMTSDGRLSRGPGYVYSGAQIIRTDALADIAEPVFSLNLLWDRMAANDRLFGTLHDGGWCDVGRPEGIAQAEALLKTARNV
ncbi:nucleotidyltransferase family protein [Maritimibacter sp. DP1N21-5]|uniref:nucleotidyltransferase family protein n=1 Tax=Maritimibacter sp. DP1N21-5 TaxID=2836867 RepID=UPI001C46FF03|nr:nucleotidyltransferase family protein [Maritimibacter sp. DP1N21-5]MBV7410983.1 nucleotidyltransferase family protein [Maritimibacter sp. DP1N21-5]